MELFRTTILLPVLVLSQAFLNKDHSVPGNFSGSRETDEQQTSNLTISHPLRLSQHCSGVVEVLHRGLWRPVTFDLGSAEWAKVVEDICTNLSCGAVYERRQNGTATLNYSSSTCLSQCVYRDLLVENCTELSYTDCSNLTEITCGHQAVRLVGGSHHCEGRVELWREEKWGTVCDDSWDLRDGGVVCAQLGCGPALNVSGQDGSFEAGVGLVLLDEVNCGGSERNLWECPSLGTVNDCGHKEDAAVVCSGIPSQPGNETSEQNTQTSTTAGSVLLVTSAESRSSPPVAAVWGCIALSIALLLTLLSNASLFLSYRRRAALLVHQRQDGRLLSIQSQHTDRGERVNLLTVTTDTADYTPQYLSQQPTQNDTDASCDSDYENYDFNDKPSVAMATALVRVLDNGVSTSREPCETTQTAETSDAPEKYNIVAETINGIERKNPATQSLHSLVSSSTSSGECYENIETLEKELLDSGPDLRETALTDLICGREPSLGSSSSTSSGESYYNVGMAVEQHLQSENTYTHSPVQSTSAHQDQQQPVNSNCHLPSSQNQEDSSSSSSSELYENIEVQDEEGIGDATVKEVPDQSLSDSDYDDITNY
ncbi:T-cell differentiation antigen CD6 isoform X1 [Oncorhynchus kisutch]|uniref:T-cell differentiation antigen CD6 isoform X1 n=1 Tax=Oncorhynchus kisutch TaxID=8019 RepID=UPI0012DD60EF|nr:T-cell differentiation antigen CD6 isoform X1 [Oncorhynchus kisutch]XP_031642691.1 T-cell differentiation antigen CD6 isoform X1 [Oncorhynchus kisutch]XP_031642692.1 T-cell differentiation antigen CD6 isoform X1 [Oncorhynchus kisutch]XP_031642693.1 T-cell differentiation antigen CD6 isoform X1 [Oncorhynchus kisutch]